MPGLRDVTFRKNWVKDIWDLSVLLFIIAYKSTIISK